MVFVDLGLPSMSGLDVITWRRASWADVPIIVLSARGAERDKVEALDAGATDYVTKPFGIEELMARLRAAERIRAAMRPATGPIADATTSRSTTRAHRVHGADGTEIHLTPIEWALLAHLVQRPGRLVTHTELLQRCGGRSTATRPTTSACTSPTCARRSNPTRPARRT